MRTFIQRNAILFLVSIVASTGCATTRRTTYHHNSGNGGYSSTKIDESLMVARFSGNGYTSPNDALFFSKLHAVQVCKTADFKMVRIFGSEDKTTSSTTRETSSSGAFYGRFYGGNSTSWDETTRYPSFNSYFACTDKAFVMKTVVDNLAPEQVAPFVQDLLGAVQVKEVPEDSPNFGKLQLGDVILKVNDHRITNLPHLWDTINQLSDPSKPVLSIVREGKHLTVDAIALDSSRELEQETQKILIKGCRVEEVSKLPICIGVDTSLSSSKE